MDKNQKSIKFPTNSEFTYYGHCIISGGSVYFRLNFTYKQTGLREIIYRRREPFKLQEARRFMDACSTINLHLYLHHVLFSIMFIIHVTAATYHPHVDTMSFMKI